MLTPSITCSNTTPIFRVLIPLLQRLHWRFYHPAGMLLKVILCAYAEGVVSSRGIERLRHVHVNFIALCPPTSPRLPPLCRAWAMILPEGLPTASTSATGEASTYAITALILFAYSTLMKYQSTFDVISVKFRSRTENVGFQQGQESPTLKPRRVVRPLPGPRSPPWVCSV